MVEREVQINKFLEVIKRMRVKQKERELLEKVKVYFKELNGEPTPQGNRYSFFLER